MLIPPACLCLSLLLHYYPQLTRRLLLLCSELVIESQSYQYNQCFNEGCCKEDFGLVLAAWCVRAIWRLPGQIYLFTYHLIVWESSSRRLLGFVWKLNVWGLQWQFVNLLVSNSFPYLLIAWNSPVGGCGLWVRGDFICHWKEGLWTGVFWPFLGDLGQGVIGYGVQAGLSLICNDGPMAAVKL